MSEAQPVPSQEELVRIENLKVYFPIKSGLVLDRHAHMTPVWATGGVGKAAIEGVL